MSPRHEPHEEVGPDPEIVPAGAPRGAKTVPDANDSGLTTPPISGWGATVSEEEQPIDDAEAPDDPRDR